MARNVDVEPIEIRSVPAPGDEGHVRGLRGCALALGLGPVVGAVLFFLTGELLTSTVVGIATSLVLGLRGAWALATAKTDPTTLGPTTWSFTPLGAAVIAATDVLATSTDLTPVTYFALSVPAALLSGGVVFLSELNESRRFGYAAAKAAAAVVLVLVPMPVGGLVGAGASLGHRMLRPPAGGDPPSDR